MATVRLAKDAPIGASIYVTVVNGRRYVFTALQEHEVAPEDAEVFRTKTVRRSSCGCRGGLGIRDAEIQMFEVED